VHANQCKAGIFKKLTNDALRKEQRDVHSGVSSTILAIVVCSVRHGPHQFWCTSITAEVASASIHADIRDCIHAIAEQIRAYYETSSPCIQVALRDEHGMYLEAYL
jgi:hypothetical protein